MKRKNNFKILDIFCKYVLHFRKRCVIIVRCSGEIPIISHRGIAQLVEYRSPKPWVAGSNPPAPAKKSKSKDLDFFICAQVRNANL